MPQKTAAIQDGSRPQIKMAIALGARRVYRKNQRRRPISVQTPCRSRPTSGIVRPADGLPGHPKLSHLSTVQQVRQELHIARDPASLSFYIRFPSISWRSLILSCEKRQSFDDLRADPGDA